jgi:gas vesicle protein
MSDNNHNVKGFLIGFLAGGTVGAIIALLTTPKSGKDFRSNIKQKSNEYLDEADKYLENAKIKAGELMKEGKRKYSMIINDIKSKPEEMLNDAEQVFKDTKEKTSDVLHSGKVKIEAETERLKSSVKAGIDAYKEAKKS